MVSGGKNDGFEPEKDLDMITMPTRIHKAWAIIFMLAAGVAALLTPRCYPQTQAKTAASADMATLRPDATVARCRRWRRERDP
jgi:hypothetical protein